MHPFASWFEGVPLFTSATRSQNQELFTALPSDDRYKAVKTVYPYCLCPVLHRTEGELLRCFLCQLYRQTTVLRALSSEEYNKSKNRNVLGNVFASLCTSLMAVFILLNKRTILLLTQDPIHTHRTNINYLSLFIFSVPPP